MTHPPSDGSYEIDCHAVASELREAMTKTEAVSDAEIVELIERSLFLASGQDDPHSQTIIELCAALSAASAKQLEPEAWLNPDNGAIAKQRTRNNTIGLSRRAANSAGGVEVNEEDLASDDRWNAGVNYAIERLCEILGVDPKAISWDAATETVNGDVMSVICNVMVAAYGEEWSSNERDTARIRAVLSSPAVEAEPVAHPDDIAVDQFAAAMKAKLAKKRGEGRSGWEDKEACSASFLSSLLHGHVSKGDPVDVANLAMMLHQRGEAILQTPNSAEHDPRGATFVFGSRSSPVSAEVTEKQVDRIWQAVLSCPHSITGEEIVLGFSSDKPGKNAAAQLHSRITDALAALNAQLKAAREALELTAAELQSSIDTHEFNSRHMIAEDSLQDAWKMLDMAREQFQLDANSLRIPLARVRAALSLDTNKGDGV